MKTFKLVLLLGVAVVLSIIVLQNQALVKVRLLWWTGEATAIALLLLTIAGGFILGLLTALLVQRSSKSGSQPKGTDHDR